MTVTPKNQKKISSPQSFVCVLHNGQRKMALLYQHHLKARCSVAVISGATTSPGVPHQLKCDPLRVCWRGCECKRPPLLREESCGERPSEVLRYRKHTDSGSSIESQTPCTRQKTDTNYANVSQLADVSMETGTSKVFFFFHCRIGSRCRPEGNVLAGRRRGAQYQEMMKMKSYNDEDARSRHHYAFEPLVSSHL